MDSTTAASQTNSDLILRLNGVDIAVIVVYFILVLGVGIWVSVFLSFLNWICSNLAIPIIENVKFYYNGSTVLVIFNEIRGRILTEIGRWLSPVKLNVNV